MVTTRPIISSTKRPKQQQAVQEKQMSGQENVTRQRKQSVIQSKKKLEKQKGAYPDPASLPRGMIDIKIQWEGKDKVLATVNVHADDSLVDIRAKFQEFAPGSLFHFLCRGKGVNTELFDIFKAKYFYPILRIRGGTVQMPTITVINAQGGSAEGPGGGSEVKQTDNPYLKKNRKPKKAANPGQPVEPEPEIVWEFQPPMAASLGQAYVARPFVLPKLVAPSTSQIVTVASAPAPKKQAPPPAPARDPNITLAQRAKSVFGALS